VVWPFGIEPEQILNQLPIKAKQVITQEGSIPHEELLIEGSVETLDARIHLGTTRIGMKMSNVEIETGLVEMVSELTAVVCLDSRNDERSHGPYFV